MKKLLLLFAAATMVSCGSSKHFASTPATIDITETQFNSADNYVRANEWMVETFNNAESVIQFTDKEEGIVKGKYYITSIVPVASGYYVAGATSKINAIITIRVKDNAAKITVDGTANKYSTHTAYGITTGYSPRQFDAQAELLIEDFKTRMNEAKEIF